MLRYVKSDLTEGRWMLNIVFSFLDLFEISIKQSLTICLTTFLFQIGSYKTLVVWIHYAEMIQQASYSNTHRNFAEKLKGALPSMHVNQFERRTESPSTWFRWTIPKRIEEYATVVLEQESLKEPKSEDSDDDVGVLCHVVLNPEAWITLATEGWIILE